MPKRIGIIGGMSPESTIEYYRYLIHTYTARFSDHSYPEILIYSVSFQPYIDWPAQDRWDLVADGLGAAAQALELAGAGVILIATNTMHLVFDQVQARVSVPLINLLDTVAAAIRAQGLERVALLGTRFTMEKPLYPQALARHGIAVRVPEAADRALVNRVIYDELVAGIVRAESRAAFVRIIADLAAQGAQGVILGCTEIPLLVRPEDVALPLFDTTRLHAEAALQAALCD